METSKFDIIILGGGVVGLTAALLCAQQNFKVAIIEALEPEHSIHPNTFEQNPNFDHRVSAMTKSSIEIFKTLNVWDKMQSLRVSPYEHMRVFDALGHGEIHFSAEEINEAHLGYIIENRIMTSVLWQNVLHEKNIQVFSPAKVISIEQNQKDQTEPSENLFVQVSLNKSILKLQTSLIVGADGAHSWLRNHLNLKVKEKDYEQMALVAIVHTENTHQKTAWQRFLPSGPLAFLPLSSPHISSIVWSLTPNLAAEYLQTPPELFCENLAHAFDYKLGKILSVSKRHIFPLKMLLASQDITQRAVLIGDAWHVIHPLAGQGVNLGILDAKLLANTITFAREEGRDIAQPLILKRFIRARKEHILTMTHLVGFFKNLFSIEKSSIILLRSLGLNFVNKSRTLKESLIRHATGLPYLE